MDTVALTKVVIRRHHKLEHAWELDICSEGIEMTLHGEAVFLGSLLFQISINIITTKSVLITNEI